MALEFQKIQKNKKQFLDLLLLADEQEDMIERYLEQGDMYILKQKETAIGCVVVTNYKEGTNICEIKNLAISPPYQGKGYGRKLIDFVCNTYKGKYKEVYVGTGEVPGSMAFYKKCGFDVSHKISGFFTDHYHHIMIEDGVQLVDMVYLKRPLR